MTYLEKVTIIQVLSKHLVYVRDIYAAVHAL